MWVSSHMMPSLRKYNISSTSYFFIGNYICMVFLKVPIYLHKWPKLKVRTYFQDTGNICVKIQLLIIFHFKILCIIYYNDIEFAQMTSVHDTHCNEGTSNVSLFNDMDRTQTWKNFFFLKLAQMTLSKNHDTPSDYKQYLCEVEISIVSQYERYKSDTYNTLFFSVTLSLKLHKWPWVKIMTNSQVKSNLCVR